MVTSYKSCLEEKEFTLISSLQGDIVEKQQKVSKMKRRKIWKSIIFRALTAADGKMSCKTRWPKLYAKTGSIPISHVLPFSPTGHITTNAEQQTLI